MRVFNISSDIVTVPGDGRLRSVDIRESKEKNVIHKKR
jgi:hypothetical protein